MSSDEMSWIDEQVLHSTAGPACEHLTKRPRLVLAEIGAHAGARMCSTVEELAGGTGSHVVDPTCRRLLEKFLEQERPRHLWLSLR